MSGRIGSRHMSFTTRGRVVDLLKACKTLDEFEKEFAKAFGKPTGEKEIITRMKRIQYLWYKRVRFIASYEKAAAKQKAKQNVVMIPARITHKAQQSNTAPAFADDAILVKIHNLLAEIVQLHKEQIAVSEKQYKLFEGKLQRKDVQQPPDAQG